MWRERETEDVEVVLPEGAEPEAELVPEPEPAPEPEPEPKPKRVRSHKAHPLEGLAVRGSESAYYLVENGKRRLIPSVEAFYKLGLRPVLQMSAEDLEDIPLGDPFGPSLSR